MRVVILGPASSASPLPITRRDGHEVEVVDRRRPALETSFANSGEVSPGYSAPWAGPGLPFKALKWLAMEHAPLVVRWSRMNPAMALFGLRLLRNCTHHRYEVNKGRMVRLAEYSRDCLMALRQRTGLHYDERMQGTLQLFRTQDRWTISMAIRRFSIATACPMRCSIPSAASRLSRRCRASGTNSSADCACRATRQATASSSPPRWRRSRRRGA